MKVLYVIHSFPPYSWTGSEIYAYNLAREISVANEVSVFHRIADPKLPEYNVERGKFSELSVIKLNYNFSDVRRFADVYRNKQTEKIFADLLSELKPDLIHYHHLTCLSTGLPEIGAALKIPQVMTLHDYWLICQRGQMIDNALQYCPGPSLLRCRNCLADQASPAPGAVGYLAGLAAINSRRRSIKKVFLGIDHFIAPSQYLRRLFIKNGLEPEKIFYSDYGFDLSQIKTVPKKDGGKLIRFAYIGSLMYSKGAIDAVRAFRQIAGENLRLTLYGAYQPYHGVGGYLEQIEAAAEGDDRIKIAEAFSNDRIGEVLSETDALLFTSIWRENSPLIIHEAFASGTPVIASDIGAVPELVVEGRGGVTYRAGDAGSLAERIRQVLENPGLLKQWAQNAPPVKLISEDAAETMALYEELVG